MLILVVRRARMGVSAVNSKKLTCIFLLALWIQLFGCKSVVRIILINVGCRGSPLEAALASQFIPFS